MEHKIVLDAGNYQIVEYTMKDDYWQTNLPVYGFKYKDSTMVFGSYGSIHEAIEGWNDRATRQIPTQLNRPDNVIWVDFKNRKRIA